MSDSSEDPREDPRIPTPRRRTGIDRRWIKVPGFHPERRSGQDRREQQEKQQGYAILAPLSPPPSAAEPTKDLAPPDPLETDQSLDTVPEEAAAMVDASVLSEEERRTELFYLLFRHMRF